MIVTGADRKNHEYHVSDSQKFTVDGKQVTVDGLKKGQVLTATIYHTNESTVVTTTAGSVSGSAPAAAAPASSDSSSSSSSTSSSDSDSSAGMTGSTLPKTASPLASILILGLAFLGFSFGLRKFRK